MQEGAHLCCDESATLSRVVHLVIAYQPAMDCVRDERIIGESNRSSAHCHAKSKMGTVSDDVAGFAKCVAECNFDCRNVRLYRGGLGAGPDFRSSAQATPGADMLRLVISQRFWQSSLLTFAPQEKSPAHLTSFAGRWRNNTGCWSLPLPACIPRRSAIMADFSAPGREKLPAHGPFVLAANHCSHLDALVLEAALKPRHRERAFPIAAGDVFFQTTAVSVFSAIMLNALPMWRKNCGPHALAELRRKLQEEKAIFIIFPEGGRTRTGSMMPFKHGLGMLVAETNVPVVPCGLIGTFEALPPNRKVPRPVRIKLIIGEPLNFAATANNREGWSQIARSLESSIRNLADQ